MDKDWSPYVVQQGDLMTKLAFRSGVEVDDIWSYDKNKDLAELRQRGNTLRPGDVLYVPPEASPPLSLSSGTKNKFKAVIPEVPIHLRLKGDGSRSYANLPFVVHGATAQGKPIEGTTTADGDITFDVPVITREVEVRIPTIGMVIPVHVGDLDPIDEPSGITQRLQGLGYLDATVPASPRSLRAAVAHFQRDNHLPETGAVDDATRDAIRAAFLS